MTRARRLRFAAVPALALTLFTPGCQLPPGACPAIAWINSISVDTSAYPGDVFVQVCTDAGCSDAPGASPTPSPDFSAPRGDGKTFELGMSTPDVVTARVYDASGTLLAETEELIDWTRSTDPCGGPATAPPVALDP